MFKETYQSMNQRLAPGGALEEATLQKMENRPRRRHPMRRVLTTAAAFALILCLSVTAVAAAVNEGFRQLLFGEDAPTAEALTPQTVVGESDGIRMEVLGSMAGEKNITVYYTLQDSEEKKRISDLMSIYYNIYINDEEATYSTTHQNRVISYDSETQTALCRLDLDSEKEDSDDIYRKEYKMEGTEIRLEIFDILNTVQHWDYVPLDIEPELEPEVTEWDPKDDTTVYVGVVVGQEAVPVQFPFKELYHDFVDSENRSVTLKQGEAGKPLLGSASDMAITACGFINDGLHIQITSEDFQDPNNSYSLICTEAGNSRNVAEQLTDLFAGTSRSHGWSPRALDLAYNRLMVDCHAFGIPFIVGDDGRARMARGKKESYSEFTFSISPEKFSDYEFFICAWKNQDVDLDISVEFPTGEGIQSSAKKYGATEIDGVEVTSIEATPMFLHVESPYDSEWNEAAQPIENVEELEVVCGDKITRFEVMEFTSDFHAVEQENGEEEYYFIKSYITADAPIDPKTITAIRVNGQEIPLTPMQPAN